MAIYTQYGRYLKAKMFKEMLEDQGRCTYMLLGLGDPEWDTDCDASDISNSSIPQMPMAPYNTSILTVEPSTENQFYDNDINQYFSAYMPNPNQDPGSPTIDYDEGYIQLYRSLSNGLPHVFSDENPTGVDTTGNYIEMCKDLLPPFPCFWGDGDTVLLSVTHDGTTIDVTKSNYSQCYIVYDSNENQYILKHCYETTDSNDPPNTTGYNVSTVEVDLINGQWTKHELQYISELYLRGLAITNTSQHIISPVGLLGAVKCSISFVKDIGNDYTGETNQFWYGDRYWEIVYPDDNLVNNYIKEDDESQKIYPHHLLISSTINPRQLCPVLKIDQNIVPRQIALFTSKNHSERYFRVGSNVFNFGQYKKEEADALALPVLNFTLPCKVEYKVHESDPSYVEVEYPEGDFKFILNDYIKGGGRIDVHSAERIGYVIGF